MAALNSYALGLVRPYIHGPTGISERMRVLKQFQANPLINTIFLGRVEDNSIVLPEITCLIQVSSYCGSRRQEAQRQGRILLARRRNVPDFKIFFYSPAIKNTNEMFYTAKRQQSPVGQCYTFEVLTDNPEVYINVIRVNRTKFQQKELPVSVLLSSGKGLESEEEDEQINVTTSSLKGLSGMNGMAYIESI